MQYLFIASPAAPGPQEQAIFAEYAFPSGLSTLQKQHPRQKRGIGKRNIMRCRTVDGPPAGMRRGAACGQPQGRQLREAARKVDRRDPVARRVAHVEMIKIGPQGMRRHLPLKPGNHAGIRKTFRRKSRCPDKRLLPVQQRGKI